MQLNLEEKSPSEKARLHKDYISNAIRVAKKNFCLLVSMIVTFICFWYPLFLLTLSDPHFRADVSLDPRAFVLRTLIYCQVNGNQLVAGTLWDCRHPTQTSKHAAIFNLHHVFTRSQTKYYREADNCIQSSTCLRAFKNCLYSTSELAERLFLSLFTTYDIAVTALMAITLFYFQPLYYKTLTIFAWTHSSLTPLFFVVYNFTSLKVIVLKQLVSTNSTERCN